MTIPEPETYLEQPGSELEQELTDTQKRLRDEIVAGVRTMLEERDNSWREKLQRILKWIASQL